MSMYDDTQIGFTKRNAHNEADANRLLKNTIPVPFIGQWGKRKPSLPVYPVIKLAAAFIIGAACYAYAGDLIHLFQLLT